MQWRRNKKDVRARDSLALASTKTLASEASGRNATKQASSTRSEGEIRVPHPLSMAWLLQPAARRSAGI